MVKKWRRHRYPLRFQRRWDQHATCFDWTNRQRNRENFPSAFRKHIRQPRNLGLNHAESYNRIAFDSDNQIFQVRVSSDSSPTWKTSPIIFWWCRLVRSLKKLPRYAFLFVSKLCPHNIANQPDALQKMTNSLLVNVDIPIDTKRRQLELTYPCKIDLVIWVNVPIISSLDLPLQTPLGEPQQFNHYFWVSIPISPEWIQPWQSKIQ